MRVSSARRIGRVSPDRNSITPSMILPYSVCEIAPMHGAVQRSMW
jgi:hypothetical protein